MSDRLTAAGEVTPEKMEAEAGRLLVDAYRSRMARMAPEDAHEMRHIHAALNAGNSEGEDGVCRLDEAAARAVAEALSVERGEHGPEGNDE